MRDQMDGDEDAAAFDAGEDEAEDGVLDDDEVEIDEDDVETCSGCI